MKIGSPPPQESSQSPGKFQQSIQKQSSGAVSPRQTAIQVGDLVKGKVVSVDSQGMVTIESSVGRFSVKSFTGLSVGDQIFVEIVKAGDNPLGNYVQGNPAQGKGQVFDILRVLMPWLKPGSTTNFQGLLKAFQTAPQDIASEGQLLQFLAKNTVGAVPDALQQIKIAALMSSLKSGASLPEVLQNILGISDLGSLDEASHPELKKMLQLLEIHGALNSKDGPVAPQSQPSQLFDSWLFPCFFTNGQGAGEWMFSFEQSESPEKEKDYTVAFYLTMSKLGDVHLQLSFRDSIVNGVFTLENEAAVQHMQKYLHELQETLTPLFGTVVFTCNTASEKSIEKLKRDLQQKSGLEKFALIDLSV